MILIHSYSINKTKVTDYFFVSNKRISQKHFFQLLKKYKFVKTNYKEFTTEQGNKVKRAYYYQKENFIKLFFKKLINKLYVWIQ